jgi:hypothetical protein
MWIAGGLILADVQDREMLVVRKDVKFALVEPHIFKSLACIIGSN